MDVWDIICQAISIIAVIVGFISFQMKTDKQVLTLQTLVSILFTAHYLMLGATDAAILNAVGIIRNFTTLMDQGDYIYLIIGAILESLGYGALFAIIMVFLGFLSWINWSSILVITGLAINTVFLSCKNPQNLRKSILVSSPMVLVYNIINLSIGGMIYESVVIVSSIVGIIRYADKKNNFKKF